VARILSARKQARAPRHRALAIHSSWNAQRFYRRIEQLEDRSMLATTLLPGFTETTVTTGISGPTAMEISPDGRLWVLEQAGRVKLVRTDGTTFTALTKTVDSAGERGLLGIAFDPNFASNKFVYLYYTNPNAGAASWAGGVHNQLSRFTVNDANPLQPTLVNEAPILDWNTLSSATTHNGGAIEFGADGMLYANTGDNVQNFTAPDGNSYRVSQSMNTLLGKQLRIDVAKFNSGVAVRNDTTVGRLIPSNNPFVGTATGINQLIYALGLRNPYTFAVQPGTGRMLINDVGETRWEEINESVAGANFGWSGGNSDGFNNRPPSFAVGTYRDPILAYAHNGTGSLANGTAVVGGTFYNPATVQFPASYVGKYFYEDLSSGWIRYFNPSTPNSAASPDGNSVAFASGTPGALLDLEVDAVGNLFYLSGADGSIRKISYQAPVITAQPTSRSVQQGQTATFTVTATGPALNYQWQRLVSGTWTNVGTNSATLSIANSQSSNAGSYRVIVSNTFGTATSSTATLTVNVANAPPAITTQPVSQQVNVGAPASLSVVASGATPLNYQWQKLAGATWTNVGTNSSTFAIAAAAVSNAGSYRVIVTNSVGSVTSSTATLSVNQLPTVTISSPAVGAKYNWGQTVSFAGSAVDPEDGTLAASKLSWQILFYHQDSPDGSGLHFHPYQTFTGVAGGAITINFDETSPYVWYRFILTATDSKGATASKTVDIHPNLGSFTVQSNPAGLQLLLDGGPIAAGTVITGTVGQPRTIGVVSPQTVGNTNYTFASWSDGGAASHTIAIPATSATYTARFVGQTAPSGPINFPQGFSGAAAQFSFNGAPAKISGSALQITDGGANQAASAYFKAAVDITKFNTQFNFQLTGGTNPTADGMTFVIQGTGLTAVGSSGGGLGYNGIAKSIAIDFDLFDNNGEGNNTTGLRTLGNPGVVKNLNGTGIDLHSGHVFNAAMSYDGTTLRVTLTDTVTGATATQTYTVNIPGLVGGNTAYVGFTGGTGGLTAVQKILTWTYSPGTSSTLAATSLARSMSTATSETTSTKTSSASSSAIAIQPNVKASARDTSARFEIRAIDLAYAARERWWAWENACRLATDAELDSGGKSTSRLLDWRTRT
jgi:glucose/arabinose dehydrogenase